jgi:type II secretory pathway component PulC
MLAALLIGASFLVSLSAGPSELKLPELKRLPEPLWGRDPFLRPQPSRAPAARPGVAPPGFSLQGVITDPERAVAIIDGAIYRKGEVVQGYRLLSISEQGVVVSRQGVKYYIGVERFSLKRQER